jgi:hypothetical protein
MKTMSIIATALLSLPLFVALSRLFHFFVIYYSPQEFGVTREGMHGRYHSLVVSFVLFICIFALSMWLMMIKKYAANITLLALTVLFICLNNSFQWLK